MTQLTPSLSVIFFGSFQHYSGKVLTALKQDSSIHLLAVVTTPPQPAGRKKELKPTEVQEVAELLEVPVFHPESLTSSALIEIETKVGKPDYILTAGYGKLLPQSWLAWPQKVALNIHFSLLPAYRGANPAEWALMAGEHITGVSAITMSPEFDTGDIVGQIETPIGPTDTRETVYEHLYDLAGRMAGPIINAYEMSFHDPFSIPKEIPLGSDILQTMFPPQPQTTPVTPYARRLYRDDGFVDWKAVKAALAGDSFDAKLLSDALREGLNISKKAVKTNVATSSTAGSKQMRNDIASNDEGSDIETTGAVFLERACRALAGFPGLWSIVPTAKGPKRMKILKAHLDLSGNLALDQVQLEGQQITAWEQVKNGIG